MNSLASNKKLLQKYEKNTQLIAGDTNEILKDIDLSSIDFVFLDGGHSYETVLNDLEEIYKSLRNRNKVILCDDYGEASFIKEVKNAIDDFTKTNNINISIIENRFAKLIT